MIFGESIPFVLRCLLMLLSGACALSDFIEVRNGLDVMSMRERTQGCQSRSELRCYWHKDCLSQGYQSIMCSALWAIPRYWYRSTRSIELPIYNVPERFPLSASTSNMPGASGKTTTTSRLSLVGSLQHFPSSNRQSRMRSPIYR